MKVLEKAPILDAILESWRGVLGNNYGAYRNHCYRVLNFCIAFCAEDQEIFAKVSIAVAFHDLGIWVNGTFDYLGPSRKLAREYLANTHRESWGEEIEAMIEQHHKLTKYKANSESLVELFRRADWIDVSRGKLRFGLPSAYIADVMAQFPNAGFHQGLSALLLQRFKKHPLSPLPMMKF
jgi:hypothetical protein